MDGDDSRRGLSLGDVMGDGHRHSSHPRKPHGSAGGVDVKRRYHHDQGVGEEDGWVRVEPRRKRVIRKTQSMSETGMDGRCYRSLA